MRLSKVAARFLLVLAAASVALLVCETTSRFLFPSLMSSPAQLLRRASGTKALSWNGQSCRNSRKQPLGAIIRASDDAELIYELKPNLDTCFEKARLKTNSQGFRAEKDFSRQKTQGSIRIVGLGDSMMFGWGVEEAETYAAKIEEHLQKETQRPVEFINTAVPGYNTAIEAAVLAKRALAYQPDIVILHWCSNDLMLPPFLQEQAPAGRLGGSALLRLISERFIAGIIMPKGLTHYADAGHLPPAYQAMVGFKGVTGAFDKICALFTRQGIPLIVVGKTDEDLQRREFLAKLLRLHSVIQIEMDESADWWLSSTNYHLNPQGHDRYAARLLQAIKPLLEK